jgi:hypothetical protein
MSEVPLKDVADAVGQSGWAIALLTATWGIILRVLVGRHLKAADEVQKRLRSIETRLTNIEARSRLRRQEDRNEQVR